MSDDLQIIERIEEILRNEHNEPAYMLGGYIVGATIVRDDIDKYYKKYPLLETIAELGADLETTNKDDEIALQVLEEIRDKFAILKQSVSQPPEK